MRLEIRAFARASVVAWFCMAAAMQGSVTGLGQ
jgi:hypothetical protein